MLTSLSDDLTNLETSVVQTFSDSQLIDFGLYSDKPVVLSTVYITEESINAMKLEKTGVSDDK